MSSDDNETGRDEFRYLIHIEKIHHHLHTQIQRVLNFCLIFITTG